MYSFCAMYSLRMSFCSVPETWRATSTPCFSATARYIANRIGAVELMVIEVVTSMTINSTAPILFAMYLAVAEKQGVDVARHVSGTLQNDILKEYIAQKEYIY